MGVSIEEERDALDQVEDAIKTMQMQYAAAAMGMVEAAKSMSEVDRAICELFAARQRTLEELN